jgi:hypothetical protein
VLKYRVHDISSSRRSMVEMSQLAKPVETCRDMSGVDPTAQNHVRRVANCISLLRAPAKVYRETHGGGPWTIGNGPSIVPSGGTLRGLNRGPWQLVLQRQDRVFRSLYLLI